LRDFDSEGFFERTMGDRDLAAEIAEAFLADTPPLFIRLSAAVSAGDAEGAGKLAHSLKGSSANMGGEKLSRLADRLQTAGKEGDLGRLAELLPAAEAAFQSLIAGLKNEFPLLGGDGS
jgi:HPt (histidine-containing phosphotransfer) domain-containing protein